MTPALISASMAAWAALHAASRSASVADAPSAVARHIDDVQHAIDLSRRQAQKSPGQVQILSSRQMAIEAVRLQQGPDLAGRASAVLDDIDAANPSHAR